MFCRYCGTNLPDDAVFCSKCGKKVSDGSASVNSAPAAADFAPKPAQSANEYKGSRRFAIGVLVVFIAGFFLVIGVLIGAFAPKNEETQGTNGVTSYTDSNGVTHFNLSDSQAQEIIDIMNSTYSPSATPSKEQFGSGKLELNAGSDVFEVYKSAVDRAMNWSGYTMTQDISSTISAKGLGEISFINNSVTDVEMKNGQMTFSGDTVTEINGQTINDTRMYFDSEYYYFDYSKPQDMQLKMKAPDALSTYIEDQSYEWINPQDVRDYYFYRPQENEKLWCIYFEGDPSRVDLDVFDLMNSLSQVLGDSTMENVRLNGIGVTVTLSQTGELIGTEMEGNYTADISGVEMTVYTHSYASFANQNKVIVNIPSEVYSYPEQK